MLAHLASLVEQDAWEHTWEDEDDDESQQPIPAPIFQVEGSVALPSSGVRQLVVGLYGAGSAFVSCAFADRLQSPAARVVLPPAKEGGKSEDVATVHQVDDATLLVVGLKAIPADRAFAFTRLLYQHLPAPEETLILHSLGRHEFHSSSDAYSSSTFRLLETRASRQKRESSQTKPPCAYLEVPNMVEGAAAAIVSHLERRGQVGRLMVSVLGEEPGGRLGLEAVQGFAEVLNTSGGGDSLLALTDAQRAQAASAYPAAVKAFNARLSLPKTSIFL